MNRNGKGFTKRNRKIIDKFGDKALSRFLSKKEIKIAKKVETIAGFWAIKEATSKALGVGIGKKLGFKDIKIYKTNKMLLR